MLVLPNNEFTGTYLMFFSITTGFSFVCLFSTCVMFARCGRQPYCPVEEELSALVVVFLSGHP